MPSTRRAVIDTLLQTEALPQPLGATAPESRADVIAFVDGQLGVLPPLPRAGVVVVEWLLAVGTAATRGPLARLGLDRRRDVISSWERLPFRPAQLYVRLVRSLVLFAAADEVDRAASPST